jgi:tRNA-Thr(GGU) m(6)t(6)A37 methyltransferase TsaA
MNDQPSSSDRSDARSRPGPSTGTAGTGAGPTARVRPIGVVASALTDRRVAPKQGDEGAPAAKLLLDPEVADGLRDIGVGDQLIVLTWLHQADRTALVVQPRDDPAADPRGVFSTRSADRPNPIGLHRVTVTSVDGASIGVHPLEAVDGTPIVDLKPALGDRDG